MALLAVLVAPAIAKQVDLFGASSPFLVWSNRGIVGDGEGAKLSYQVTTCALFYNPCIQVSIQSIPWCYPCNSIAALWMVPLQLVTNCKSQQVGATENLASSTILKALGKADAELESLLNVQQLSEGNNAVVIYLGSQVQQVLRQLQNINFPRTST